MKYYIIAGEASGDLHGSNLMRGLLAHDPFCEIRFWGGDRMAAVGGTLVRDYRDNAVMGLVEVIGRLGSILRNLRFCKKDILGWKPDAVILIDYPGFNLKIARFAHEHGFKVFYYIPPKVWARGEGRIRLLKKYVDRTFIIFPFEVPYFEAKGVSAVYNGNPLVDNIAATPSVHITREEFLRSHSLTDDGRELIALLAGSRKMEVDYLLPRLVRTAAILKERTGSRPQPLRRSRHLIRHSQPRGRRHRHPPGGLLRHEPHNLRHSPHGRQARHYIPGQHDSRPAHLPRAAPGRLHSGAHRR